LGHRQEAPDELPLTCLTCPTLILAALAQSAPSRTFSPALPSRSDDRRMKSVPKRLDDLGPDAIELILSLSPADRGPELAPIVADFLDRIGGMENAFRAIAMLRRMDSSAPRG
jgi:hypothetical protein